MGRTAADNTLLKFGAKGHLLCAGICVLCWGSDDDIRARIERYKDIDLQVGAVQCAATAYNVFADATPGLGCRMAASALPPCNRHSQFAGSREANLLEACADALAQAD